MPSSGRQVQLLSEMATRLLEMRGESQNNARHIVRAVDDCAKISLTGMRPGDASYQGLMDAAINLLLKPKEKTS